MALLFGCSKKPEANTAEPSERLSPSAAASAVANSLPHRLPAQATSNPRPSSAPSSAAEIAQALKATGNQEAAYSAIRQFAGNNPSARTELLALLKSSDSDLSALGAQGLAALSTPEAAADLVAAIQVAQPGVAKRQLAEALGSFNNPEVSASFLDMLATSQDREIVYGAQRALANSVDDALLQELVRRYEASNSAIERDNLTAAIRSVENTNCVTGLLEILDQQRVISSTEPLGLAAADTLGTIGTHVAVSNLFAHLWSLRGGASSPVYDSIARVMNPESLPLIASIAYGQVPGASLYSRMAAVQALGNYSQEQVQPALNWLIQNDPNTGIREAAADALKRVTGQ